MKLRIVFLAFAANFVLGGIAEARIWRVEQNGSGDWLTIQPAVDAAASGDTILIGPGRYDQLHSAPLANTAVAMWDTPKSLVFIGSDVDSVVVGPEVYVDDSYGFWFRNYVPQVFKNMSLTNLKFGIDSADNLEVDTCRFIGCSIGVNSWGVPGSSMVSVADCFFDGRDWPFSSYAMNMRNSLYALVENCEVRNMEMYLQGMTDSMVRNCQFVHSNYDVGFNIYNSNGTFEDNELNALIAISGLSNIVLRRNTVFLGSSSRNLIIEDKRSTVQAFDNIFYGGTETTVMLAINSSLLGSGNHFLKGPGQYVVQLVWYDGSVPVTIDLRNNYWGTINAGEIASWIFDSNDDPTIEAEVLFQPFSTDPLPVKGQQKSFGDLKSMFR